MKDEKKWQINKKYIFGGIIIVLIILFVFFISRKLSYKSEEYKTLEKLDNDISRYLKSFGGNFSRTDKYYSFKVCSNGKNRCNKKKMKKVKVQLIGIHSVEDGSIAQEIKVGNLITAGYLNDDFHNPSNDKGCLLLFGDKIVNPVITVYLDEDNEQYYYYVDLSGKNTNCHFKEKNSFITNFPDNLVKALKKAKVDLPKQFDE